MVVWENSKDLYTRVSGSGSTTRATEIKYKGKWYWEIKVIESDGTPVVRVYEPLVQISGKNLIGSIVGCAVNFSIGEIRFYVNGALNKIVNAQLTKIQPAVANSGTYRYSSFIANFGTEPFDIIKSNPAEWNMLRSRGYRPFDMENADWYKLISSLVVSNNKYYTYQNNEFIEVEPTVENFKENSVDLLQLTTPTDRVVIPMEGGEVLEDGKIYRKTIDMSKYKNIGRMIQYIDLEDGDANVSIE